MRMQYSFHDTGFRRVHAVPRLSLLEESRRSATQLLQEGGVDHVIEFGTIIHYIAAQVAPNKNYPDSEILQTTRLLKAYEVIGPKER
jgi:hypothetical protein